MEMNNLFLSQQEKDKLEIVILLTKHIEKPISISHLADRLFFSYKQLSRIIKKIQKDFLEFGYSQTCFKIETGFLV
ncbi:MAG: hypothetical protein LBV67_10710, partial [Streptococcaceae bacterium]|nr:hypothetical protein [Streptococcaceae bacterium]